MSDLKYVSNSPEETIQIGTEIGKQLKGGEVFALVGDLGTGKTHLIKGIVLGTGIEEEWGLVNSPTFVLVNEYEGRLKVYHIDAYRLEKLSDFEAIGFDDFLDPSSVVLLEWADKVEDCLKDLEIIRVELSHAGQNQRNIHIINAPDYISK